MSRAAAPLVGLLACACSQTLEVERAVTPVEAARGGRLAPAAIVRGGETTPLPEGSVVVGQTVVTAGGAGVFEIDERARVVMARGEDGAWSEPRTLALGKDDRVLLRGTLGVGDAVPGGGRVVSKRLGGAIVFGTISFAVAYAPAAIGAAVSTIDADHLLAVPVVGPWLMLANRPACSIDPDIGANCVPDTFARFGAVMSGIFQALGVAFIVAGLPSRAAIEEPAAEEPVAEEHEKERSDKREGAGARLVPWPGGVGVVGTF